MIKPHQITGLAREQKFADVYPGFIFNFRESDNATYYIHIQDFLNYQSVAEGKSPTLYTGKTNSGSMPLHICDEVGIKVQSQKLRVHYRYNMEQLIADIKSDGS